MALLLACGLVTFLEMLLQTPASIKQSPQHCSRLQPNAFSKCGIPEQKLNIQGSKDKHKSAAADMSFLNQYQFVRLQFVITHTKKGGCDTL